LAAALHANTRRGRSLILGFRAIIAVSFADIFRNNCMKNGLLPVVLSDVEINELMNRARVREGYEITVVS